MNVRLERFSMVPVSLPFTSCRRPTSCGAGLVDSVAKPPNTNAVIPCRVTPLVSTLTRMLPDLDSGPKLPLVAIGLISRRAPAMLAW